MRSQFFTAVAAGTALSILSVGVNGIPIASAPVKARSDNSSPCPYTLLRANQSTVLAWQLVGSTTTPLALDQTCQILQESDTSSIWSQLGFSAATLQAPVCDTQSPNASLALPKIAQASTKVFTTLLTSSFDQSNATTFDYLCQNLRYVGIDQFLLNSNAIINATCNLAGSTLNPQPFTPVPAGGGSSSGPDSFGSGGDSDNGKNPAAVSAYQSAQSRLFASLLSSTPSGFPLSLPDLCATSSLPTSQAAYSALQLDGPCVSKSLCGYAGLGQRDTGAVYADVQKWTTKSFLAVLGQASNVEGWQSWLCENLDQSGVEEAGLDWEMVQGKVCGGS